MDSKQPNIGQDRSGSTSSILIKIGIGIITEEPRPSQEVNFSSEITAKSPKASRKVEEVLIFSHIFASKSLGQYLRSRQFLEIEIKIAPRPNLIFVGKSRPRLIRTQTRSTFPGAWADSPNGYYQ